MLIQTDAAKAAEAKQNTLVRFGESLAKSERWKPYCESLKDPWDRSVVGILLENQRRHYIGNRPQFQLEGIGPEGKKLTEVTRLSAIGSWDKLSFGIIRAVYANLVLSRIATVQPMSLPSSRVFYLDFEYGTTKGNQTSGTAAFDSRTGPADTEYYSSETVPLEVPVRTSGSADTDPFVSVLARLPVKPGTISGTYTETTSGTVRSFTDDGGGNLIGTGVGTSTINYSTGAISIASTTNNVDDSTVVISYEYNTEGHADIPEVNMRFISAPVEAEVRKLRARWSMEAAQDADALHGINSDQELVGAMGELLKYEVDRQGINEIFNGAGAGNTNWDKTVPGGIGYTEHKLTFGTALIQGRQQVYTATGRGGTNWVVGGTEVANVVEDLPGFQPRAGALDTQPNTGVIESGTLNGQWAFFKDHRFAAAKWTTGHKGAGLADSGYIYCPYLPFVATPDVVLDDFLHRRGVMTRYATKLTNSLFFATGEVLNP